MLMYLTGTESFQKIDEEYSDSAVYIPVSRADRLDIFSEFRHVLEVVSPVARQLEADWRVTVSRATHLVRELVETLLIISGSVQACATSVRTNVTSQNWATDPIFQLDESIDLNYRRVLSALGSADKSDAARDDVLKFRP